MRASVVITTYDDDKRLELTLFGWAGQTTKDFELIVVNDGGSNPDRTFELVSSFSKYIDVKYTYLGPSKEKLGGQIFRLAAARNLGIRAATGTMLVISDCDTVPHPDLVATLKDKYREDRVLIGVRNRIAMSYVDALTKDTLFKLPTLVYSIDERLKNPDWARAFLSLKDIAPPQSWHLCWGCCFAAPLHKVKALGGFDEVFRSWGAEDVDLAERLARGAGCKFYTVPEALVYHLDHPPRDPAPYTATQTLEGLQKNWTAVRNGGPIQ